jgi:multidrug transporter EmrE-like cation transporter
MRFPRFEAGKTKRAFVYIGIMAAALTANSLFRTMAAFHLDSAILYPLEQGSALILSSLMASLFFGEKLNLKAILGIIIAFSALMIITL